MLAEAMPPEIEEDDETPPDDDLRRRPIPVNMPPIDAGMTANGIQQARAIPLGSTADLESRVRPALTRAIPIGRAIPVDAGEVDASDPETTAPIIARGPEVAGRAIPVDTSSANEPDVVPNARAIPITPAASAGRAIPIGSTEDLESRIAPRPLPSGRAIPITPGSTEDLEDKSLQTFEHPKSAPIQTGVASLWTKAENIHNPILRVLGEIGAGGARALDAVGTAVAPRIAAAIPGSTVNQEVAQNREAKQDAQQAELSQKEAVTGETKARTNAIENPQPKEETEGKTITTDEGILQWDPATRRYDVPVGAAPGRSETEGKTITTDQGVMQWNPDTKRYDIPVGGAPVKQNVKDEDVSDYLEANDLPNTPANREKARTAIAKRGRPEEGTYFPVPDGDGNITGWVNPKSRDYRPISSIPGLSGSGENGTIPTKGGAREKDAAEAERLAGVIMNKANGDPDAALKLFDQHSSDVTDADQKRLGPAIRRAIRARRQINKPQSALDKIISGDIDGGLNDLQPVPASK